MSPRQHTVQIAEAFIKAVVSFHLEVDNGKIFPAHALFDLQGKSGDLFVRGDLLGVAHAQGLQRPAGFFCDIDSGDDKGTEKVSFTAFVDTAVRSYDLFCGRFF